MSLKTAEDPSLLRGPPGTSDSNKSNCGSISKYDELIPNYMNIIKSYFAFAYIWSFGGNLHDRSVSLLLQNRFQHLNMAKLNFKN